MGYIDDDIVNVLFRAGLEGRMLQEVRAKPELASAMVRALKIKLGTKFVDKPFRFTSSRAQLAKVRRANIDRGWGFRDADFKELGPAPIGSTAGSRHNLVAVVLDVTLANAEGGYDIGRTVDELWCLAAAEQKSSARYKEYTSPPSGCHLRADSERGRGFYQDPIGGGRYFSLPHGYSRCLRLAAGVEIPKPGLRWRKVDLGANWYRKQETDQRALRNRESPHSAILAAAWLHPEWVRAMESEVIPCVRLPGFETHSSSTGEWGDMPSLIWGLDRREVLSFTEDNGGYSTRVYAVPSYVK